MNYRSLRNSSYVMVPVLLLFVYSCSSSKKAQQDSGANATPVATWQANPVTIDGDDSDWEKPLRYYDSKQLISYAITNDNDNMYIIITSKSNQTQLRMLRGGFTVWLNKAGQKTDNGAAGISIPGNRNGGRTRNYQQQNGGSGDDANSGSARVAGEKEKLSALDNLKYFSLFGFTKNDAVENVDYGKTSRAGVDVKISINQQGTMVYEAQIPNEALWGRSGNFAGREVAVGIFMDGAEQQGNGGGGRRGGGLGVGMGMGMGGFGGGGMGMSIGRSFGGGRGGGNQQPKEEKLWEVVSLAKEPKK